MKTYCNVDNFYKIKSLVDEHNKTHRNGNTEFKNLAKKLNFTAVTELFLCGISL